MATKAAQNKGLEEEDADKFIELATAAFGLNDEPIDDEWYRELEANSAVASDIGEVRYTHIKHLTSLVWDMNDVNKRMGATGLTMIDDIQGPSDWEGLDILLRQTSFRALDEERTFKFADGTVSPGALRVRFGEVEQRGIALTPKGRELYDAMNTQVDEKLAAGSDKTRVELAREVWQENLPNTEKGLREQGLGYFTYEVAGDAEPGEYTVEQLLDAGVLTAQPIVYEDFLPRSAAGIFQSNLKDEGTRDNEQQGTDYDLQTL